METYHTDKRTSLFEFLRCGWSISSKYAEKKFERFSLSV